MSGVYERVAHRIAQMRRSRGWTQERLAEEAGIGASYLARIETCQRKPTLETLDRIARAFRVPLGQLVDPPRRGVERVAAPALQRFEYVLQRLEHDDVRLVYKFAERLTRYHRHGRRSKE